MLAIRQHLENKLEQLSEHYTVFYQGEKDRHQLLENFRNTPNSVLLGVNSFWEGIDIKGDKLSCVIMVKLPFDVPNEPLIEAKIEDIEKKNKNSFNEYIIPNAIIKFKQGFGRLIRSEKDKGIFILLDTRVLTKPYGKFFLESLPKMKRIKGNDIESIFEKMDKLETVNII